jgi:hypothetical protein
MASFKDKHGVEWLVEPTISICRRLKAKAENPIDVLNPESLSKAFDDPYSRFDLLWAMCEGQATERGLNVDAFDLALASEDAFIESARALREALNDFFLRMGMVSLQATIAETVAARERLDRLAMTKIKSQKAKDLFEKAIAKADAAMDEVLDEAEAKLLSTDGLKSTSSPESSD